MEIIYVTFSILMRYFCAPGPVVHKLDNVKYFLDKSLSSAAHEMYSVC